MTMPSSSVALDNLDLSKSGLNFQGIYPCPICRHGQISELALMEAFACNFCRHIFTADLLAQSLRVEDSSQAYVWCWTGDRWRPARPDNYPLTLLVWIGSLLLILLPPGLIWLSYHTFPPLPDSPWYWFPILWAITTFCLHTGFVFWLLAEHQQLSLYVILKVRLQRLVGQL